MGRDAVWASLGAGAFRVCSDRTLEHTDDVVRDRLTAEVVAELVAAAREEEVVVVPLEGAVARIRRDGDAVVGLILVTLPPAESVSRSPEREVELRHILERASEGIVLHRGGTIVYANSSAAAILDVDDRNALAGTELPGALCSRTSGSEIRLASREGPERLIEVARSELTYEGEDTDLVLLNDLSERRVLQAKLTQSDRLATVGMLAASIAHEVNNPLTYVMNYVECLDRDLETMVESDESGRAAKLREGARAAAEGCHRVRDIVRDLKTFARVDAGANVPIDVNRALRSAIQMAGHQVRARARLRVGLGALPAVRAHDGRLCQVFLNLLLNAAQAIDKRAKKTDQLVEVRSWTDAGMVFVSIKDTGGGIAPEHLSRLFEPFFSTKPEGVGTGLGLWICHDIVHQLEGHITVETTHGEGSEMTVVLPVVGANPIHPSSMPPAPDSNVTTIGGLRRILVVDDEPALRELLAEALGEHADVTTASGGHEARELLEHDPDFDVILCDLMMPAMSGVDLYHWVDRAFPWLARRMVFMTGASHSPDIREFLDRVHNEHLDKPFRVRDVERLLDRVMDESIREHA